MTHVPHKTPAFWSCFAALSLTPGFLILSNAFSRYLANQGDLGYQQELLVPYLVLTVGILVACVPLILLRQRSGAMHVLTLVLLLAPAYFLFRVGKKLHWTLTKTPLSQALEPWLLAFVLVFLLAGLVILARRTDWRLSFFHLCALLGPCLILADVANFALNAKSKDSETALRARLDGFAESASEKPNVYHLLLDGLQRDMFEYTFPQAGRAEALPGFTYFPHNIANYGRTRLSIPSTFHGSYLEGSQVDFVLGQFQAPTSFLHGLKAEGYQTLGLLHFDKEDAAREDLFDKAVRHAEHTVVEGRSNPDLLRKVIVVGGLPSLPARSLSHRRGARCTP